jgi:hypothetical protein
MDITRHLVERDIIARRPLISDFIHPVLHKEIDNDNIDAIKCLLGLYKKIEYRREMEDCYSYGSLLERALRLDPDDQELPRVREDPLHDYFTYIPCTNFQQASCTGRMGQAPKNVPSFCRSWRNMKPCAANCNWTGKN